MKWIEEQMKGIQRMINDDRYCVDIVQQLSTLSSAADEVAYLFCKALLKAMSLILFNTNAARNTLKSW